LTADAAGNLYGTTYQGGSTNCGVNGCGVVFELSPAAGGGYTESVIYSFQGGDDGQFPFAGVIFDAAGNLYGTTARGGAGGCGTVFELTPAAGGWTKSLLYAFPKSGLGGSGPVGLVFDGRGNLYGPASYSGPHNSGVIYELSPSASGWVEHVLHAFSGGADGAQPYGTPIFDTDGNLYGTGLSGGVHGAGVAFELEPQAAGTWNEVVLHAFTQGADGGAPEAGLTFDASGNLYGATVFGGNTTAPLCSPPGCGVVFELTRTSTGWKEKVLHTFSGDDGNQVYSTLVFDSAGNAYGTTQFGGNFTNCPAAIGCGVLFELSPTTTGGWTTTSLHRFQYKHDGAFPLAGPYLDPFGNLFGTTTGGENMACEPPSGCGIAYELTGVAAAQKK
jgi:uncharacterized repeat protein (TIGR03803 family)